MNVNDAIRLAELGFKVFPIFGISMLGGRAVCACGNGNCGKNTGKHPHGRLVPNGCLDATRDTATIAEWWTRVGSANIGIATDGLLILDVDPRHGGDLELARLVGKHRELEHTVRAISGSGGGHIYFQKPASPTKGKFIPGVDIKTGPRAYVVAPPSVHLSGRRYYWAPGHHPDNTPIAPLPDWLLEVLTPTPPVITRPVLPMTAGQARRRLEGIVGTIAAAREGERNHVLFWGANRLREMVNEGALSRAEAEAFAFEAARAAGLNDNREISKTIASAFRMIL